MKKNKIIERVLSEKSIAVIRLSDATNALEVVDAIAYGGVTIIEITLTTPDAMKLIEQFSRRDDLLVGAGTVLDKHTAKEVIKRGAKFIVSPILNTSLIEVANKYEVASMIGAMTPTEIYAAYQAGADIVKVFPAEVVGTSFFKSVKAPLPQIQMMPTGGVTLTNAGDWLTAGACAVGIGGALIDVKAIAAGNFVQLTENARVFRKSISKFIQSGNLKSEPTTSEKGKVVRSRSSKLKSNKV
jgi:2-dehydro-3-deoxyphosphogluconate aldolase / (4S)-4-hydroxy-2-oxoglutarate aldolase